MTNDRLSQLSIVVYDGHFDKIHYALAMASAAAAIDTSVTLFFTMDAARSIMKPDDAGGQAAWRSLPVSQGSGTGGAMDDGFAAEKIGTFEELLSTCMDFGVTIMVCHMGLKARGLSADELRDDIPVTSGGLVTFLSSASGSVVFIQGMASIDPYRVANLLAIRRLIRFDPYALPATTAAAPTGSAHSA